MSVQQIALNIHGRTIFEHKFYTPYLHLPSNAIRLLDLSISFLLVSASVIGIVHLLKEHYLDRKRKVDEQKSSLKELHDQINQQNRQLNVNLEQVHSKSMYVDSLLRELNHRVKNNLQIVSSILTTRAVKINNPEIKEVTRFTILKY